MKQVKIKLRAEQVTFVREALSRWSEKCPLRFSEPELKDGVLKIDPHDFMELGHYIERNFENELKVARPWRRVTRNPICRKGGKMKAGRELDEAVAKEVFGWTEKEGSPGVWRMNKVGEVTLEGHLPEFSTSQSDVQAVRRAIGNLNLGSTFQKQLEKVTGQYGDKTLGASPEHICRAAIESVREK